MITARPLTARRIIAERIRGLLLGETGAVFSPLNLFRNGEEGFYNDIQTYATTYFEDTAGTDPAELEDTIALILDQSQGLELGEEKWTGSIVVGAAWTDNGDGSYTATSSSSDDLYKTASAAPGSFVVFSGTVSGYTSSTLTAIAFGTDGTAYGITSNGNFSVILKSVNGSIGFTNSLSGVTVSNLSIRELPGNHLTQATAGARPKLSARYNLLERTEQLSTSPWVNNDCSLSQDIDDFWEAEATGTVANIRQTLTGVIFPRVQIEVKAGTSSYPYIYVLPRSGTDVANQGVAYFDLINGVTADIGEAAISSEIVSIGDGVFIISAVFDPTATASTQLEYRIGFANSVNSQTSTIGNTIKFRNPDSRHIDDTDQPAYQRVTTATDYDTEGFDPYLQFDLVDDALVATIPAITGGTLVLATRDGIWIDDDINASAGTFSVGPTTYTGGPAGLLSVIGNKLIGPPLLLDRQLTASEKNAVIQWFQSRGAGALYVLGEELVTNGTFDTDVSEWVSATTNTATLSQDAGEFVVTTTANFGRARQQISPAPVVGDNYLLTADITEVQATKLAIVGITASSSGASPSSAVTSATPTSVAMIAVPSSTVNYIIAGSGSSGVGDVFKFDNVSLRKLTQPGA